MGVDFLLINPWIYDFAAYDFWLKPYGLLSLGGKLRYLGYSIYYLDLLDPFSLSYLKNQKEETLAQDTFIKKQFLNQFN